jgi:hypothetical protein
VSLAVLPLFISWPLHNENFIVKSENGNCQFFELLGTNAVSKISSATLSEQNKNNDFWRQLCNDKRHTIIEWAVHFNCLQYYVSHTCDKTNKDNK